MNAAELGDNRSGGFEVFGLHERDSCVKRQEPSSLSDEKSHMFLCGDRKNARMALDQNAIRAWISTELKAMGRGSAAKLAAHMGIEPHKISRISATKPGQQIRDVKAHELRQIIEFFGKAPPGFEATGTAEIVPAPAHHRQAAIVGIVEAGAWRQVDDTDQSEQRTIAVPEDEDFPNARVLVFEVAGDSMNALPNAGLVPGALAICIAYEDVAHRFPLRDGLVVVVQRESDGGHFREWTIKQVEIYDDRIEFHPRSLNPKHAPIVAPIDLESDDGTKIEVIAVLRRVQTATLRF